MLEGASVMLAHEKADQSPLADSSNSSDCLVERHAGRVDDGEVRCQRGVQRNEPVVEHGNDVLGHHIGRRSHGGHCSGDLSG